MKKDEIQKRKGLFIAAFGVFFLIGNLVPNREQVLAFWPIFLIVGGLMRAHGLICLKKEK